MVELFEQFYVAPEASLSFAKYVLDKDYVDNSIHYHSDMEISYVKSGSGVYSIGNRPLKISAGDIVILKGFEHHFVKSVTGATLENIVIMANPQFLRFANEHFLENNALPLLCKSESLPISICQDETLAEMFLLAERLLAEKEPMHMVTSKCTVIAIISRVIGILNRYQKNAETGAEDDVIKKIDIVMAYIDKNILEKLTLEELAQIVDLNPAYLSAYFKKHTGIGITEYILQNRISLSVNKLQTTDLSVKEIALMCGFNNTTNFNKAFRNILGKTPSEMRNRQ